MDSIEYLEKESKFKELREGITISLYNLRRKMLTTDQSDPNMPLLEKYYDIAIQVEEEHYNHPYYSNERCIEIIVSYMGENAYKNDCDISFILENGYIDPIIFRIFNKLKDKCGFDYIFDVKSREVINDMMLTPTREQYNEIKANFLQAEDFELAIIEDILYYFIMLDGIKVNRKYSRYFNNIISDLLFTRIELDASIRFDSPLGDSLYLHSELVARINRFSYEKRCSQVAYKFISDKLNYILNVPDSDYRDKRISFLVYLKRCFMDACKLFINYEYINMLSDTFLEEMEKHPENTISRKLISLDLENYVKYVSEHSMFKQKK